MKELPNEIPQVELLLELQPEELAAKVLFLVRKRKDHMIMLDNYLDELRRMPSGQRSYPSEKHGLIDQAMREAFAWLEAQGLLIPASGTNGKNGWRVLSRRAQQFEDESAFANYKQGKMLPRELLHSRIRTEAWLSFSRGAFSTAVFEAMREVEIMVREAAGYKEADHGVPMIRRAFDKNTGPLTDQNAQDAEKEALSALFAGAIGSYKNPHSHRRVDLNDPTEAAEIVMLASHLIRIVESRTSEMGKATN